MKWKSISQLIRRNLKRNDRVDPVQQSDKALKRQGDAADHCMDLHWKAPLNADSPCCLPTTASARRLAAACGIPIIYETLPLAFGRVIYLAEASLQPPRITVNQTAIAKLAEAAVQAPAAHRDWFMPAAIAEVVIAHELYHILAARPSSQTAERAAHEFAQTLTGLPFSPRVYEAVLQRTVPCRTTTNIT